MGDHKSDGHVVVRPEDVTDEALLPRQFRFLEGEVRELIGLLRRQVIPKIDAIAERITALEHDTNDRRRIAAVEEQVAELRLAVLGHQ